MAYDKLRVQEVIDWYDRLYPTGPDSIAWAIAAEKYDQEEMRRTGRVSKSGIILENEAGRRLSFTMPSGLYLALKKKFPTIFTKDKKNFKRDFPVFFKAWLP